MAEPSIVDINTIPNTIDPSPGTHGIMLKSSLSQEFKWTFLDDAGIDLEKSFNIDHTNHTQGIITLNKTVTNTTHTITTPTTQTTTEEYQEYLPRDLSEHSELFYDSFKHAAIWNKRAHNIGILFYNNKAGYLKRASFGNFYSNQVDVSGNYVRLFLYKLQGNKYQLLERGIDEDGRGANCKQYVGEGVGVTHQHNDSVAGTFRIHSRFSGNLFMEKGWYFLMPLWDPASGNSMNYDFKPRWQSPPSPWIRMDQGSHPYENRVYDTIVESPCPYRGVEVIELQGTDYPYGAGFVENQDFKGAWNMYTILQTTNSGPGDIVLDIENTVTTTTTSTETVTNVLMPPGCVFSQVMETDFDILRVNIKANIETPPGSSYKLYVSNDNGAHYFQVTGEAHSFSTIGDQFVWKVCMEASTDNESPKLKYVNAEGWGVKVTLYGIDEDTVPVPPEEIPESGIQDVVLDGCMVSKAYNGNTILKEVLENTVNDQFSHWEWVRLWATGPKDDYEEARSCQSMRINIENSDGNVDGEGNLIWNKIIGDLQLFQFMHDSVDYNHYVGAYEADEYNFRCHLDVNLRDYTYMIDPMTTAWTSAQGPDMEHVSPPPAPVIVTATTDTGRNINTFTLNTINDGVIAYKELNKDLSDYNFLSVNIKVGTGNGLAQGDLKLILSSDENGENPYEIHNIPTIEDEWGYVHCIIKLRHPILLSNVEYLVLKAKEGIDVSQGEGLEENCSEFMMGEIEGIATEFYPLYGPWIRLRVCLSGYGGCTSTVRKVGFIPITK
jgi:hypothetical protein